MNGFAGHILSSQRFSAQLDCSREVGKRLEFLVPLPAPEFRSNRRFLAVRVFPDREKPVDLILGNFVSFEVDQKLAWLRSLEVPALEKQRQIDQGDHYRYFNKRADHGGERRAGVDAEHRDSNSDCQLEVV
jgi:hypothetical protein